MGTHFKALAIILIALWLLPPSAALAQSGDDAQPPDDLIIEVVWDDIPDILPAFSWSLPQCGAPDGPFQDDSDPDEYEPQDCGNRIACVIGDTFTRAIRWLSDQINSILINLACFWLTIAQHMVNFFAWFVNQFICAMNFLARLFMFLWLNARNALYWFWYLFEVVRDFMQWIRQALVVVWQWFVELSRLAWDVLLVLGDILHLLWRVADMLLRLLAWIGSMVILIFQEIILSLKGEQLPPQLDGETHPVYQMIRGVLDALHSDTRVSWLFVLYYALVYLGFVAWLAKFLSSGKE
jgi:hypothetical protein